MDVKYVNVMKGVSHRINSSKIRKYNDARKLSQKIDVKIYNGQNNMTKEQKEICKTLCEKAKDCGTGTPHKSED